MSLINVVLILLAIGIVLWLINTYVKIIDAKVLKIINVVVIVAIIIWLLYLFGIWDKLGGVTIRKI